MKGLYIFLGIVLVIILMGGCSYNTMNGLRGDVNQTWGEVQSSYQRRMDLIPNLVATVKGVANFEQQTLTQVTQARASASSLKVDAKDLTPEKLQQIQASQAQLSQALGRLMVVSERYPELRATENFRDLQAQLEGTENRIKFARDKYNQAVRDYNVKISNFPQVMFAGIMGFKSRPMFEAEQGAQSAPKVQF
ncbi:MAG: LemA family protein [Flavipsychrobacter sp.]